MAINQFYGYYNSPIGLIEIAVNDSQQVTSIKIVLEKTACETKNNFLINETISQLEKYFANQIREFNLPLAIKGTYFQELVWSQAAKIPYGTTINYQTLANEINKPQAARAVGNALGKNPLAIVIPCHRIVAKNGDLVNYFYGKAKKQFLLNLEKRKTS